MAMAGPGSYARDQRDRRREPRVAGIAPVGVPPRLHRFRRLVSLETHSAGGVPGVWIQREAFRSLGRPGLTTARMQRA